MSKPLIGITLGDAAGIGPEIILKTAHDPDILSKCRLLILGDSLVLQETARLLQLPYIYPIHYNIPGPTISPVTIVDLKLFKKLPFHKKRRRSNQSGGNYNPAQNFGFYFSG